MTRTIYLTKMIYIMDRIKENNQATKQNGGVEMNELKGYTVWEIDYIDGTKERFKAFTKEKNKALQIAQFKALNGQDVKQVKIFKKEASQC